MRLRVFLAIGSEVIDVGVRRLLEFDPSIEVAPRLSDGCDIVLVDAIAARGQLGSRIRHLQPALNVVGFRPYESGTEEAVEDHLSPDRWIAMSVSADGLSRELREAHRAHNAADPTPPPSTPAPSAPPAARLTPREGEILGLICAGQTNREIAATLFLSVNSVKSHVRSLYRKIDATRRSQAVVWGWERGY